MIFIPNIFAREFLQSNDRAPQGVSGDVLGLFQARAYARASIDLLTMPLTPLYDIYGGKQVGETYDKGGADITPNVDKTNAVAPVGGDKSAVAGSSYIISNTVGHGGINNPDDVTVIQKALNVLGTVPALIVDGLCGPKTTAAIVNYQVGFLKSPDGRVDPGGATLKKLNSGYRVEKIKQELPKGVTLMKSIWPADTDEKISAYFGSAGENIVLIQLPYSMRLAWDVSQVATRLRCNKRVSSSLLRIFNAILSHYGSEEAVRASGMDLLGGCYNKRKMTGSSTKWSRHSWGIAIDLDPSNNRFNSRWPGEATMPEAVIKIFEAEGWKSGARAWGKDAMHFQATR